MPEIAVADALSWWWHDAHSEHANPSAEYEEFSNGVTRWNLSTSASLLNEKDALEHVARAVGLATMAELRRGTFRRPGRDGASYPVTGEEQRWHDYTTRLLRESVGGV